MKNTLRQKRFSIIATISLAFIILFVGYTISQSQYKIPLFTSPNRPANCVPLPWLDKNKPVGTPLPDSRQLLETPGLIEKIATVSPLNIAHTYDLRPDLSPEMKLEVIVFRCNGTEDLYLVDPQTYDTENAIPMQDGDVILYELSPADMYRHGPAPTVENIELTISASTPSLSFQEERTSTVISLTTLTIKQTPGLYPGPSMSTP